ncbi:hypothetical protein V8C43DRAFT_278618 [Trichoderma afarasin]
MGAPPTSGYCQTCRKRRVKCDKGTPACQRCIKAGYRCKGYDLPLRMQNMSIVKEGPGRHRLARIPHFAPDPSRQLSLVAFKDHICFTYLFENCSWAHCWRPMISLTKQDALGPLDYNCSLALAYAYFGVKKHEKKLETDGRILYGKSLHAVKTILESDDKQEIGRTTSAVLILGLIATALDDNPYMKHHDGVIQILKRCGPKHFQQEPLLTAFRRSRGILVCKSFALRRRCFLEEPEWKTIPFEISGKDSSDELLDILCDIPGQAEDCFSSPPNIVSDSHPSPMCQIARLSNQLRIWRRKWDEANPRLATGTSTNAMGSKNDGLETLAFYNLKQATEIFTYNAALLYLSQLRDAIQDGRRWTGPLSIVEMDYIMNMTRANPQSPLLQPDPVAFTLQPALEAANIFPYLYHCMRTEKLSDVLVILAPLGIVYCALQSRPNLLSKVAGQFEMPFINEVGSMLQRYSFPSGQAD